MPPAGRDVGERRAGGQPDEPPLGVEDLDQRMEVVLVDPAAVQQDDRALGLAGGLADAVDQLRRSGIDHARGFTSGVTDASILSRSGS